MYVFERRGASWRENRAEINDVLTCAEPDTMEAGSYFLDN